MWIGNWSTSVTRGKFTICTFVVPDIPLLSWFSSCFLLILHPTSVFAFFYSTIEIATPLSMLLYSIGIRILRSWIDRFSILLIFNLRQNITWLTLLEEQDMALITTSLQKEKYAKKDDLEETTLQWTVKVSTTSPGIVSCNESSLVVCPLDLDLQWHDMIWRTIIGFSGSVVQRLQRRHRRLHSSS